MSRRTPSDRVRMNRRPGDAWVKKARIDDPVVANALRRQRAHLAAYGTLAPEVTPAELEADEAMIHWLNTGTKLVDDAR